jgi:hypothetical protein
LEEAESASGAKKNVKFGVWGRVEDPPIVTFRVPRLNWPISARSQGGMSLRTWAAILDAGEPAEAGLTGTLRASATLAVAQTVEVKQRQRQPVPRGCLCRAHAELQSRRAGLDRCRSSQLHTDSGTIEREHRPNAHRQIGLNYVGLRSRSSRVGARLKFRGWCR